MRGLSIGLRRCLPAAFVFLLGSSIGCGDSKLSEGETSVAAEDRQALLAQINACLRNGDVEGARIWGAKLHVTASTPMDRSQISFPNSYSSSAGALTSSIKSSYASELGRHAELGNKTNPSGAELREYLILDGRLGVKEGQWSASDFERYTGEKY